jgi:N-acetylglutamate synthase-like GNAT family acetyltransferase
MVIRRFRESDALRCYNIVKGCLQNINRFEGSLTTTDLLLKNFLPSKLPSMSREYDLYIIEDKGKVMGFAGIDSEAYIRSFFIDYRHLRMGYGSQLLRKLEYAAKKKKKKKILARASPYGEKFYLSHGFRRLKRQTKPLKVDGEKGRITYVEMEKNL